MTEEVLKSRRELVNGEWHSVHRSKDGLFVIDMGADDQRPDDDGVTFFRPICVAEMMGDSVYTYHDYCGACRKRIGSLGEVKEFCPRCGKGIAHYVFAMGVTKWRRPWNERMPDVLPEDFGAGHINENIERSYTSPQAGDSTH